MRIVLKWQFPLLSVSLKVGKHTHFFPLYLEYVNKEKNFLEYIQIKKGDSSITSKLT